MNLTPQAKLVGHVTELYYLHDLTYKGKKRTNVSHNEDYVFIFQYKLSCQEIIINCDYPGDKNLLN